jgi:hypothetical protein
MHRTPLGGNHSSDRSTTIAEEIDINDPGAIIV